MKTSVQTVPKLSREPYRNSAVSLRELSRDHRDTEPSDRTDTEPLTIPKLSRWLTAEFPCKHRLSALIFKHRLNLSAQILQADSSKQDTQLVAPRCGAYWLRGLSATEAKTSLQGLELKATVYER